MKNNIEFIHDFTEDQLKLQAVHWYNDNKDICVVCIHGMGQNIIENYFSHIWGEELIKNNIGFIYGHNRGYSHINDIITKEGDYKRIGTTYEIFEECVYDIDLWVNKAKEKGYKKIILLGHSLGCNKAIYYLYTKGNVVDGLVLASPPDMLGITLLEEPGFDDLMKEALENINLGNQRKLLKELLGGWNYISSESFVNFYNKNSQCDNLPIERNPKHFPQLAKIDIPILTFSGSEEFPTYLKLNVLKEKAIKCPNFTYHIIDGANHFYKDKELETSKLIINWINENIKKERND